MRASKILLFLTAAILFLVGAYLATKSSNGLADPTVPRVVRLDGLESAADRRGVVAPSPQSAGGETLESNVRQPAGTTSTEATATVSPVTFAQKYEGLTGEQLVLAEDALSKILQARVLDTFEEIRKRGAYETIVVASGQSVPSAHSFPDGSPRITQSKSIPLSDGRVQYELLEIRPSNYPELQLLYAEVDWLVSKTPSKGR